MNPRHRILAAQAVASLGLAAGGAAGGLLAVAITGDPGSAAAPLGAMVLGAGLSAPLATAVMARTSRVAGLVAGYLAGALGAGLVLVAAAVVAMPLLLVGNALLGAGNTAVMLSRYAVADLEVPARRGRAISASLATITLGAIIGPNLLGPAGGLATAVGLPEAAGLYVIAVATFVVAPLLLVAGVPRLLPMVVPATPVPDAAGPDLPAGLAASVADEPDGPDGTTTGSVGVAIGVLTAANVTMVSVMAVSPAHLDAHGHGLGVVGLVVSLHIGAMFAASPLLGRLSDRYGPSRLAVVGALLLAVAGLTPVVVGVTSLAAMTGLLVLLGLAWNVQVVAGSALLHRASPAVLRPRNEGRGELAMSLGAALGSLVLAGPLMTAGGIPLLAIATVPLNVATAAVVVAGLVARSGAGSGRQDRARAMRAHPAGAGPAGAFTAGAARATGATGATGAAVAVRAVGPGGRVGRVNGSPGGPSGLVDQVAGDAPNAVGSILSTSTIADDGRSALLAAASNTSADGASNRQ